MPDQKREIDIPHLLHQAKEWKNVLIKVGIGLVLTLVLAFLFPRGEAIEFESKVGTVWSQKDLIAPFSFPVFRDEREYGRDVEEARKRVFDVFERDTIAMEREMDLLGKFFTQLTAAIKERAEFQRILKRRRTLEPADSARMSQAAAALDIPFTDPEWNVLGYLAANNKLAEIQRVLTTSIGEYLRVGILDRNKPTITRPEIALRKGTVEEIIPLVRLYDKNDIVSLLEKELLTYYGSDNDVVGVAYKIGIVHVNPNVRFDKAATDQAAAVAADAVPRTIGFVQENERVVSKHERITPETKLKLDSLRRAKAERGPESDTAFQRIGIVLHVGLVVMLFSVYLFLFRKRVIGNARWLALIALLIALEGVFAYLTRELDVDAPLEYLIFVPAASMLLTIIFDSRVGFYGTVVIAYLVGGVRGNDYSVALAALVAGALSVYTVRDMKHRTQIFRSLGFIFLGYGLTIVALGLERFETLHVVGEQLAYALVNATVSPVLTYGLLIFLERVFRVTTDLTLMELSHFDHPLLRMLSERAPGTFHHSMIMATLAEAGTAAVGGNEVLARVGAYFHDIGKVVKPVYFVENQKGSRNRHDKLAPRMSSLIIAAHVKDGIALAREHNLPEDVINFIPMHHGTTRIDYFYRKAVELAQNSPDETKLDEIIDQDYRYPGPRPQTKETGIMMLADTVEAAVRTIDDPSPQRLEASIDELIRKRFEEGELDECPLTMRDLTRIKAAFLGVLVGMHHQRVKYPEEKRKPRKTHPTESPVEPPAEPPVDTAAEKAQDERLSRTIKEIDKE